MASSHCPGVTNDSRHVSLPTTTFVATNPALPPTDLVSLAMILQASSTPALCEDTRMPPYEGPSEKGQLGVISPPVRTSLNTVKCCCVLQSVWG